MPRRKPEITSFYYITHVDNLPSILQYGILSHEVIERRNIPHHRIYDAAIVSKRGNTIVNGSSLWHYANLYFQPRNPMMYRVLRETNVSEIVVIGVRRAVLDSAGALVTLGNAAASETEVVSAAEGIKSIATIWKDIDSEWWRATDGSKRRIMAEVLVPDKITADQIHTIYVSGHGVAESLKGMHLPETIPIVPEPKMFFMPVWNSRITDTLSLLDGDMFFSKAQTLTVSVNTQGIMGKGVASRAKYQFPDVYVAYQDACRKKLLTMGKPYLYKREELFDAELAEDPATLPNPNERKWFLLFATKRRWREDADLDGIEEGLRWIGDEYQHQTITSLALPALGCGLGRLDWRDVGPKMCQALGHLSIKVRIYLPREANIDSRFLSREYLLAAH
ncbi:MAG TPA: DarT ssDNA thymidine ADP-ribosyltransferase family protein [Candidatus Tyrphobacter sp.]